MDESTFETFEEELSQPLPEVSPPKPLRAARTGGRAEMYAQRRTREEAPAVQQQVPKMTPREHPTSGATSLSKARSIQNLPQMETPWEGVTLNRCLIIAISILVLTSGLQRINEVLRGRKDVNEEFTAVSETQAFIKRSKLPAHEPETSLWDTLFWWLDDDDDEGSNKRKSKRATQEKVSRGIRHRTFTHPTLLKQRESKVSVRRRQRNTDEIKERVKSKKEKEIKVKKTEEEEEEEEEEKMEKSKKAAVKDRKQKTMKKLQSVMMNMKKLLVKK